MESIYGNHGETLEEVKDYFLNQLQELQREISDTKGFEPINHCMGRVKSEESMREKCRRKGLPETTESALQLIYDAIGVRVVCSFVDDVYLIRDFIAKLKDVTVVEEKDYIAHVKPNGYRSYHMILQYQDSYYVEVQLRTISQDTWAALEHNLKYKKEIQNQELICEELKRCADELASTDLSMQTIRNMIMQENE